MSVNIYIYIFLLDFHKMITYENVHLLYSFHFIIKGQICPKRCEERHLAILASRLPISPFPLNS